MEKEWGNKAQRASFKALRDIFPQVDVRILKGTVLDHGDDIDAAVEFILTEVLEQASAGNPSESSVKEQTSEINNDIHSSETPVQEEALEDDNNSDVNHMKTGNLSDSQLVEMTGGNLTESELFDLSVKSLTGTELPAVLLMHGSAASLSGIPGNPCEMMGLESVTSEAGDINPPYSIMLESMTLSQPDIVVQDQLSGNSLGHEPVHSEVPASFGIDNQPAPSVGTTEELVPLGESLYGSVMDAGTDGEYMPAEVGGSTLEDSWSEEKYVLALVNKGAASRWAYNGDADESDMQMSKSSLLAVTLGQFDSISRDSDEGSRLMESSILDESSRLLESSFLEETLDGLFNSSSGSLIGGSSQLLGVEALDELVNEAKTDKEALVGAIEEMRAMRQKVEQAEAAAQQSKKAALIGGLDVLAQVDEMRVMLTRAREANEMHAGEVYGEKAVLATESQELQRRLIQLRAEKDKAFAAVSEMQATLQARIDRADSEREEAEAEKRQKEESARELLAIEEELMAKVAQESRDLDAEEEACSKLREFLIERGSIVDSLQGEVAIVCEDVEVLKKQLDEGILSGSSSYLQMISSCSSGHSSGASMTSGGAGSLKIDEGLMSGLSHSESSYRSASRGAVIEDPVEDLAVSEVAEVVARMTLFEGDADQALQAQNAGPFHHNSDSGDDEGWHLLGKDSLKGSTSPPSH